MVNGVGVITIWLMAWWQRLNFMFFMLKELVFMYKFYIYIWF